MDLVDGSHREEALVEGVRVGVSRVKGLRAHRGYVCASRRPFS